MSLLNVNKVRERQANPVRFLIHVINIGVYHSRNRGIWIKGESSGATQDLLGIALDCDRDTLQFTVWGFFLLKLFES